METEAWTLEEVVEAILDQTGRVEEALDRINRRLGILVLAISLPG